LGATEKEKNPSSTTTYPGMKRLLEVLNFQSNVSFFSVAILHKLYGR
jgi:hypothetical protein